MRLTLESQVICVLADPPVDGLLVFAGAEPLRAGDVLVALAGEPTRTKTELDAAYPRAASKGQCAMKVWRAGDVVEVEGSRVSVYFAGTVAVRAGVGRPIRPGATVASLDYRFIDLRVNRLMNGFGGKPGKVHGWETHSVKLRRGEPTLASEVDLSSFGRHHFSARVTPTSWHYEDHERARKVVGSCDDTLVADAIPSLLARLAAMFMPRVAGAVWHYTPIAEDEGVSSFPLVPHASPRAIECVGEETVKVGRRSEAAFRFEHTRLGESVATTWVDEDGGFVQHAEFATLLRPAS